MGAGGGVLGAPPGLGTGAISGLFQTFIDLQNAPPTAPGPYRPPNWGTQPQIYSMTCTLPATPAATVTTTSSVPASGEPPTTSSTTDPGTTTEPVTYYFDAVKRVEHSQELVVTKHPVQVGPAIVDHAYLMPSKVILEIAISDALDSFAAGQYTGGSSKSVSAYKTFKQIQAARVPITLVTRYDTYENMMITDVRGTEDGRTLRGFRGTLYFEQVPSATLSITQVSVRQDATGATGEGTKATEPVPATTNAAIDGLPQP